MVWFVGVVKTERYSEMSFHSISFYRAADKPAAMQTWRSATSHISRFIEIHSASASTKPYGLRKPAARYTPSKAKTATSCDGKRSNASKIKIRNCRIWRRIQLKTGGQFHEKLFEKIIHTHYSACCLCNSIPFSTRPNSEADSFRWDKILYG
ncbi:MAG: hypothetical protein PHC69_08055 [Ruminiclostridium sp.]|nr:hypothetical protein [Ruminiclostridium sp.]